MWPFRVVMPLLLLDHDLGFSWRLEFYLINEFVSESRVEALAITIFRCQMIWDARACELSEDLAHLFSILSRLALMVQATGLDGHFFDFFLSMMVVSLPR